MHTCFPRLSTRSSLLQRSHALAWECHQSFAPWLMSEQSLYQLRLSQKVFRCRLRLQWAHQGNCFPSLGSIQCPEILKMGKEKNVSTIRGIFNSDGFGLAFPCCVIGREKVAPLSQPIRFNRLAPISTCQLAFSRASDAFACYNFSWLLVIFSLFWLAVMITLVLVSWRSLDIARS